MRVRENIRKRDQSEEQTAGLSRGWGQAWSAQTGWGWRLAGSDELPWGLTFLPLPRDEGVKHNGKGLPQLPGDASTASILPRGPESGDEDLSLQPEPQGLPP